jgi:phage tail P2-like protein
MSDIFSADYVRELPDVLKKDPSILAIAKAVASELALLAEETRKANVYAAIDELPETVLDALSYDFKIDWWDASLTLDEKRATLKSSWDVHRHLGTAAAVEKALGAIYPDTIVDEWFEYGGDPYHFKLRIPVDYTALDSTKHTRVLSLVSFYKNLRSVLDEIEYYGSSGAAPAYAATAFVGCEIVHSATAHNS